MRSFRRLVFRLSTVMTIFVLCGCSGKEVQPTADYRITPFLTEETPTRIIVPSPTNSPGPQPTLSLTPTLVFSPEPTVELSQSKTLSIDNLSRIAQIGKAELISAATIVLAFRNEATWLIVLNYDGKIEILEIGDYKQIALLERQGFLPETIFASADGQLLAAVSAHSAKIVIWNLETLDILSEFDFIGYQAFPALPFAALTGGQFSPENNYMAVWGCRVPELNEQGLKVGCISSGIEVFDLETETLIAKLTGHQASTNDVVFHPHEPILVSTGLGESILKANIYVWDFVNNTRIATFTTEYDNVSGFFRDDGTFMGFSNQKTLIINPEDWSILTKNSPSNEFSVGRFVYSSAAKLLITYSLDKISFRDPDNETIYFNFDPKIDYIYTLVVDPDGENIYTLSSDSYFRTWGIP